jgi:hypothetical protein
MKDEQRERKKKEGKNVHMVQNSGDEISSSDEENLVRGTKTKKQMAFDALEDPGKVVKELLPGGKGREEREQRETAEDRVEVEGERSGF